MLNFSGSKLAQFKNLLREIIKNQNCIVKNKYAISSSLTFSFGWLCQTG